MLLSPLLQEYLIENGSLPLPATGRLIIQHTPAYLKDADQTFIAPNIKIVCSDIAPAENELQQLIAFIAGKLSISNKESKGLLEKEMGLNAEFEGSGNTVNWPEWNLFQDKKDDSNPQQSTLKDYLPAFPIEKIFRQPDVTPTETVTLPAEHIAVEATSDTAEVFTEMEEPIARDYWWVWALVIFVVSILLIVNRYA